jgi:serine/threonine protein phosphatase PrpC
VPLRILHSGLTDTGRVRSGNEDAWAADPTQGLYIVADGMGGHNAGEIAASLVVESLPKMVRKRVGNTALPPTSTALARRLRSAVTRLSRDVYQQAMAEPGLMGMGATVVLAMVNRDDVVIVHMGDSRAYLLRGGRLRLLTKDHSVVQELIDRGHITPEEAETHPARNRITASVGMPGDPSPDSRRVPLQAGDRILLCSDGLAGMIADEEIAHILGEKESPEQICTRLIDAANHAGGHDNITAVVLHAEATVAAK